MRVITGIGYITEQTFGGLRQGVSQSCEGVQDAYAQLKNIGVLSGKVKNFGRFDDLSKRVLLASALALRDGCIEYPLAEDHECGIIFGNSNGSLESNLEYFDDYISNGRMLARGNLFVYTLPSSGIGEAAIYYGLRGPLLYLSNLDPAAVALTQASDMIADNEAATMLVLVEGTQEMICFVVRDEKDCSAAQGAAIQINTMLEFLKKNAVIAKFNWI